MYLVIGSVTADVVVPTPDIPALRPEDGFRASNLVFTPEPPNIRLGGNGGNSAYVLAGLGGITALAGAVGRDLLGDALVGWLEAQGVDLTALARRTDAATSVSTILRTPTDRQLVFHHLGATLTARPQDIPGRLLQQTQALLAASYPILAGYRPGGFEQVLAAVAEAGGVTALDIGPAIGPPVTLAELTPLLPMVHYLLGNVHELCSVTGAQDWSEAVDRFLAAGAGCVVVKQGASGATLCRPGERLHTPAYPVTVRSTIGAGDAFDAGLLFALGQGMPVEEAMPFAGAVAALVVSHPHGILGAPTRDQVEAFLTRPAR